ncbi:MAG TPA: hypothetical protein VNV38_17990 [Stellaceae bacterium]|nr:hypothetical protein [Stellaceae bacterium]
MKYQLVALTLAGVLLAQMNSYNGGIPITPGTSVPESSPAYDRPPPSRNAAPSSSPAASSSVGSGSGASTAPAGPAYSFGAAPPPVVSPGR